MQMGDMVLQHTTTDLEGGKHIGGAYGPELLLDCNLCDVSTFTKKSIKDYMKAICKKIKMQRADLHFSIHPTGDITAIQFILTSAIVVHTSKERKSVYVDIFSCKLFSEADASGLTREWFKANMVSSHLIQRG